MPTDISHLPPTPRWIIPAACLRPDDRPADRGTPFTDWRAHLAAGRIGANPPAAAAVVATRDAAVALFAARLREQRA